MEYCITTETLCIQYVMQIVWQGWLEQRRNEEKSRQKQESKKWKEEILSAIISTAIATPWLGMCTVYQY